MSGSKIFTTHSALRADRARVYVRFGPGVGGIGSVLIETKAQGVKLGKPSPSCPARNGPSLLRRTSSCRPRTCCSREGGFKKQIAGFNVERIGNTARSLALGRYAYETARAWAMQRKQFGRPLCEFQGCSGSSPT